MEALSVRIKTARGTRSQEEFAGVLGCSLNTLKRWEEGETEPRSAAHIRLLEMEGVKRVVPASSKGATSRVVAA